MNNNSRSGYRYHPIHELDDHWKTANYPPVRTHASITFDSLKNLAIIYFLYFIY